jgi:hypothetical protein
MDTGDTDAVSKRYGTYFPIPRARGDVIILGLSRFHAREWNYSFHIPFNQPYP